MSISVLERLWRVFTRSKPLSDDGRYQRDALTDLFGVGIEPRFADHFQVQSQRPSLPEEGSNHPPRLTALSALGFPSLFVVSVHLDDAAGRALEGLVGLPVPPGCCGCRRPAIGERSISGNWLKPDGACRTVHASLPVCDQHSVDFALPLIALTERIPRTYLLTVVGGGAAFLSAWAELLGNGDVTPPWRVFAGEAPEWGGWRQGNGEYWLHHVWLPFWSELPDAERQRYLGAWEAPPEWRDVVMDW